MVEGWYCGGAAVTTSAPPRGLTCPQPAADGLLEPSRRGPKTKVDVPRRSPKVLVGREQDQIMTPTELDKQRVDRSDLYPSTAACVAHLGSFDMVLSLGLDEGEGRKPIEQLGASLRPSESLQQFLKDEPGGEYLPRTEERVPQSSNLGHGRFGITAQCQRPDAGIDQHGDYLRVRSAL